MGSMCLDQMSLVLLLDERMSQAGNAFAPHKNVPDLLGARKISNVASITKPVVAMTSFMVARKPTGYEDQSRMMDLLAD